MNWYYKLIKGFSSLPSHLLKGLLHYRFDPSWRDCWQFGLHLLMEDPVHRGQFSILLTSHLLDFHHVILISLLTVNYVIKGKADKMRGGNPFRYNISWCIIVLFFLPSIYFLFIIHLVHGASILKYYMIDLKQK